MEQTTKLSTPGSGSKVFAMVKAFWSGNMVKVTKAFSKTTCSMEKANLSSQKLIEKEEKNILAPSRRVNFTDMAQFTCLMVTSIRRSGRMVTYMGRVS